MTTTSFRRGLAKERDRVATLPIWNGRVGGRNLRTLMAAYNIAIRAGDRTITYTCRLAAERVGVNKNTAAKAIANLKDAGWLSPRGKVKYGRDWLPLYFLSVPEKVNLFHTSLSTERDIVQSERLMYEGSSLSRLTLSLWDRGRNSTGLGPTAGQVYGFLQVEQPTTVKALRERTGLCLKTVRKALRSLEGMHLARNEGRSWFRTTLDPSELAEALDAGKRRRDLALAHAQERDGRERVYAEREATGGFASAEDMYCPCGAARVNPNAACWKCGAVAA